MLGRAPWWAAWGGRVYRGDQRLYWDFCFAQRGAVTWHGLQSFPGRQSALVGPRVVLNRGRGSAGAGLAASGRGSSGILSRPSGQSVTGQHPGTGLFRLGEILSWRVDPCCCLVEKKNCGFVLRFSFLCPRIPVRACWSLHSGSKSGSTLDGDVDWGF